MDVGKQNHRQCTASSRDGSRCRRTASKGSNVCYMHGGAAGSGRPETHALYSRCIPDEWREDYNYFKTDPNYLSLKSEIALAQTNMARFLDKCDGSPFNADMREHIIAHLEHVSRLKEKENKRIYQENVVNKLLAEQLANEARILAEVLTRYVDADTAERIANEFANAVEQSAGVTASVSI